MGIAGTKLRLNYDHGMRIDANSVSETEVRSHAHAGPAAGQDGSEACQVTEPGPQLYFVNWIEAPSTVISQVLDLNTMTVVAFVTFDAGGAMRGMLSRGSLERIE
jgi:hypothetical protein